ncbi:DUF202 domain-containing protein [Streptomyces sp. NPDC015184]|uniref:DUF202 domain-containing protein n=1 Tax=Streptomyces sp. NPDC015184 TaxID=3364946 RepID=UPI0036FC5BE6
MSVREPADWPRDPGLQPERTALAGRRTALSALVTAVLPLRDGLTHPAPAATVAGVLLLGAAALSMAKRTDARVGQPAMMGCAVGAGLLIIARALFPVL